MKILKLLIYPFLSFVLFYFIFSLIPISRHSFNNLSDLKKYAAFYKEDPKSDNVDWVDPEFISFYKEIEPSFYKKILLKLRLSSDPIWDDQSFKKLINRVTKKRISEKLKSPFDANLTLPTGARCIVWGDLQGALHSMVRCLDYLKKHEIINNNLLITQDNVYLVFVGDAVSRSPYSLELLNILLVLMDKNPQKVIYIQGNHEKNKYWESFSMFRSLKFRLSEKNGVAKFSNYINQFFSTLPNVLGIRHKDNKNEVIYVAHSKVKKELLNNVNVKTLILGEKRLDVLKETKGLEFIGYNHAASQWSLISCPTRIYQDFFKFHYDTFTELSIGESLSSSILILHDQDVRDKKGFERIYFDPIFGTKLKTQKSITEDKNISTIGSTMALTGVTGPMGRETKSGVETAMFKFNSDPKNPDRIKMVVLDDGYIPRIALRNINTMHKKYKIDTFLMPIGTPTLTLYINLVRSGKIAVLFPWTGGPQFRKPEIKNIIHFRTSYEDEVKSSIEYMINEYGIKNFAFFYAKDPFGIPLMRAARAKLKKRGIEKWLELPHIRTQSKFEHTVKQLKVNMPEALCCFSTHFSTQGLINQLGTEFFLGRTLFIGSFLYSDAFRTFLERRGISVILSSVVPHPKESNLEIAKEHIKAMKERGLLSNTNSLEGYISTELFIDALKNIKAPYSKEKIIKYFEELKNYKFKGLTLTFNPEKRDLSQPVWIRTIENKWIKYKSQ